MKTLLIILGIAITCSLQAQTDTLKLDSLCNVRGHINYFDYKTLYKEWYKTIDYDSLAVEVVIRKYSNFCKRCKRLVFEHDTIPLDTLWIEKKKLIKEKGE